MTESDAALLERLAALLAALELEQEVDLDSPAGPQPCHRDAVAVLWDELVRAGRVVPQDSAELVRAGRVVPQDPVDLDARLRSRGMHTVAEMMGVRPTTRWAVQAGMDDVATFRRWIDRRYAEFLRMRVTYELDPTRRDALYEWVLAHCGALAEVRDNLRAATDAGFRAELDLPPLSSEAPS